MSAFSANTQSSAEVELYPTERILCMEIIAALNRKYSGKKNSKEELVALAEEAENRFKEIGLNVVVDISNIDIAEFGDYSAPVIEIVGRLKTEATDFERMSAETQAGLLDGVVGKITEDGRLVEPDKKVSLWTPDSKK